MNQTHPARRREVVVEEHLRPAQVAARVGLSLRVVELALAEWRSTAGVNGLGPVRRYGRAVLIPASSVNAWLERVSA
jgi:hypothetical protein